ncbi:MAG: hypothetical protein COW54_05940 [Rhodobacteraceae bacterium CG17_big_fil_post_rev_8_21_14_2_50_63_15]|nr:helix-turn-helix domain-containing protein [Roseovarius sp.]PIV79077.1 MAG: hypothetical protein COW54_05940 [Rhodobacteraceae bacterium CG17_big_fil_post_rev_8_21_14_2_50_63_15]
MTTNPTDKRHAQASVLETNGVADMGKRGLPIQNLIPEEGYAEWRGVSLRTVQRERAQRIGPPFIKLGRNIYYRPAAIEQWLLAQEQAQPRAHRGAA